MTPRPPRLRLVLSATLLAAVIFETRAFAPWRPTKQAFLSNLQKANPTTSSPLHLYVEDNAFSTPVSDSSVQSLEDYVKSRGGNLPIKKVLIANNGMAATKSILSMRQWAYMELGDESAIKFVAMATPEDIAANAEFVRLADSFVEVTGGKNLQNYANVTVITSVAKEQGECSGFC